MRRIARSCGAIAMVLGGLAHLGASAGVHDSFRDVATSVVDYAKPTARAAMACELLADATTASYTVIEARRIESSSAGPEHCALHGVIAPEVQFWLYLPSEWNQRLYMVGHGGYAGEAPGDREQWARRIAAGLSNHFAVVFTNTGHDAAYEPLGSFAYNEIQKTLDFGYRAVHLTATVAKALAGRYYGPLLKFSYLDGCSTGGRQGLMSAQRFPEDFDGIVAGAPVNAFTDLHVWMAWVYQALETTPLAPSKVVNVLAPRILARCDALDGAKDGLIQNPHRCAFNPSKDLPSCAQPRDDCFTREEIAVLERVYSPVISNGQPYFPGLQLGAEPPGALVVRGAESGTGSGWLILFTDERGLPGRMEAFADTFFKYLAFARDDRDYDWRRLDFDRDLGRMSQVRTLLDAVSTDMRAYQQRGGKIVSYHGWADAGPPAAFTVKYYEDVLAAMGERETRQFYRLFMVPGMFHCGGGFGPDVFDPMTALIQWVEADVTPESLPALQPRGAQASRTRPLCPYPQIAAYEGAGDLDQRASFTCRNP